MKEQTPEQYMAALSARAIKMMEQPGFPRLRWKLDPNAPFEVHVWAEGGQSFGVPRVMKVTYLGIPNVAPPECLLRRVARAYFEAVLDQAERRIET